jgi:hypothetical protein
LHNCAHIRQSRDFSLLAHHAGRRATRHVWFTPKHNRLADLPRLAQRRAGTACSPRGYLLQTVSSHQRIRRLPRPRSKLLLAARTREHASLVRPRNEQQAAQLLICDRFIHSYLQQCRRTSGLLR